MDPQLARRLWQHLEPVHDLVYFGPCRAEQADALGLRGYWMGYFAFRAAPLGPVGPEVVTSVFYGFHRSRVARALPDAWSYASPAACLAAREAAVDAALTDLLTPPAAAEATVPAIRPATGRGLADAVGEAAELAWAAAQAADTAGRPLAAANQALPRPPSPRAALWLAATVLREHRGDGHNAVLLTRGIRPAEAHLIKAAAGEADEVVQRTGRGFPDAEWDRARAALTDRGLLDGTGLTAAGRAERDAIEAGTDAAAVQPWEAVGRDGAERLVALLHPLAAAVLATGLLPVPNPAGLVWPPT